MIVLAADTSTMTTSVAVVERGPIVRASGQSVATPASDNLMPLIERALADAGIGLPEIDAFAIGAGPGSFTGLRIGMATLKGLAFATGKPVWAVSSLEALAMTFPVAEDAAAAEEILVAAVMNAMRGEVFAGWFRRQGPDRIEGLGDERVMTPAELIAWSAELPPGPRVLVGDGAVLHRTELTAVGPIRDAITTPSAEAVGRLALSRELPDALVTGAPTYVRPGPPLPKKPQQ
jgi:tRNA threonylcarbamoyl adenosine modification protein YeaZ